MREVTSLLDGGFGTVEVPGEGDVRFAVKPVRQGQRSGAFVVAYFTAPELPEFDDAVGVYAVVAWVALLLIGVGGWVVAGRLLKPLRELRATAEDIRDSDLTRRITVEGNDDVSDLARTLNAMLDRLENAFATQREFLDDAGHELRTPLTILRGHMEILDKRNTELVEATRILVLDEIDRMGRLVDDLVVLAKAGRPDFLRLEPMDVGVLTDDVLDKARGLGEREWRLDARASGSVITDRQRLTQALVQLAANAVRHTQRHQVIAVGSLVDGQLVRLWVRDTGPGVAAEDARRIFERFERARGSKRSEGSGLGLSIVRAIAEAHDGHVALKSQPGSGATFTVVLPLRPVPPGQDPADDRFDDQLQDVSPPTVRARAGQQEEVR
ncbi:MAG: HAMP domain-containing histidine kinase [Nocardioidaceae bacterium]|nr:HAMP domain-containing histidine kinase [Nocardioidaceae bacterium]